MLLYQNILLNHGQKYEIGRTNSSWLETIQSPEELAVESVGYIKDEIISAIKSIQAVERINARQVEKKNTRQHTETSNSLITVLLEYSNQLLDLGNNFDVTQARSLIHKIETEVIQLIKSQQTLAFGLALALKNKSNPSNKFKGLLNTINGKTKKSIDEGLYMTQIEGLLDRNVQNIEFYLSNLKKKIQELEDK